MERGLLAKALNGSSFSVGGFVHLLFLFDPTKWKEDLQLSDAGRLGI